MRYALPAVKRAVRVQEVMSRTVSKVNTVVLHHLRLPLERIPGRRTCAGLSVLVRRHLERKHSVWYGGRRLGTYDARGRPLAPQSQGQAV